MEFAGTSRFQILRQIGSGGMGIVYEALDREQRLQVALKCLRSLDASSLLDLKAEFRVLRDGKQLLAAPIRRHLGGHLVSRTAARSLTPRSAAARRVVQ